MRRRILIFPFFLGLFLITNLLAQDMPLVYDVENTGADYPTPYLPAFDELPSIEALPDPFEWSNGSGRIKNLSDWRYRRAEIGAEILNYELGTKPSRPDTLEAVFSDDVLSVTVTVDGNSLTLTAPVVLPEGDGPFPAVIGVGWGTGSLPSDIFTSRGVATVQFNYGQLAPQEPSRGEGGFYNIYPDTKVGSFAAWAWGISRIIDGLEMLPEINIDLTHLAVTGCSFAGKISLFSGAFDERIALTISQEPGGGGDAAWRVSETLDGSVETLKNAQGSAWYYKDVSEFNNAVDKLPYDHHELMAMIAPRALLVLGNPDYEWLADESGYVGCKAAYEVWKALGVPERFGFSKVGGHSHCSLPEEQEPEVIAFVEKFLLGNDEANTDVAIHPGYTTNLSKWITWDTPTLGNDTTYFATLVDPSEGEAGLDTNIILRWNKVENAEKYYIQLSSDQKFTDIIISDSTTTDTLKAVNGVLENNNKYYWRVQVKSSGGLGPWSDVWSFVTTLTLPDTPETISSTPDRTGYVTFSWTPVENMDQYLLQTADQESFNRTLKSVSTSDTVKTISWFLEGRRYYWRVRAENLAGNSAWNVGNFVVLNSPTGLELQSNGSDAITLTWTDKSDLEEGYVIERKQSTETSFAVVDTVKDGGTEYIDGGLESTATYTYRTKAYSDTAESGYSNEATSSVTGIKDELGIPTEFSLSQNYPNPFNPTTNIKFGLPESVVTKLTVYDMLGRKVQVLIDEKLEAGYHEISFNAGNLANGVYFYRIQAGDFIQTKKLLLLK